MILSKEHELVKKAISDFCQREIYDTDISAKMDQEAWICLRSSSIRW